MNTENLTNLMTLSGEIKCMVQFLNYAYNTPETGRVIEMGNDEKMGGQLFFFIVEGKIQYLCEELQKIV